MHIRFKVDKLIRDKMPEIMRALDIKVFERIMDKDEYEKRLRDKIQEEATEVFNSFTQEELKEELADLLEVMISLAHANNLSFQDILTAQEEKRIKRGGFENKIYNEFVEIASDNPVIEYYKERPKQYPEIVQNFKKIMIFGRPGSGKSTFANRIAKSLNLPLHHLDKHFFEANWIEKNHEEFLNIQQNIVNINKWIIDGNSTKSLEMRYSKADLVLYFNYPRLICYFRILKRYFNPNKEINDRAIGCQETIRGSLIKYMWSFEKRVEEQLLFFKTKYPNTIFKEIKNDSDLQNIEFELESLK